MLEELFHLERKMSELALQLKDEDTAKMDSATVEVIRRLVATLVKIGNELTETSSPLDKFENTFNASIQPGTAPPDVLLIARMEDGAYLLQAWPCREPSAYLSAKDAGTLLDALNSIFREQGC